MAIGYCLVASTLHAAVVVEDSNLSWGPGSIGGPFPGVPDANYAATIFQDAGASDFTSAWFYYDGTGLRGISENLDEGSDWYVVGPGQVFSNHTIQQGLFAPLITQGPNFHPPVAVASGQDIYLGVASSGGYVDRDVFGWVLLRPIGASVPPILTPTLTMIDNAMSYDSEGIIIGTGTAVPEPGAALLAAFGVWLFVGSKVRRGRTIRPSSAAART
jgi:hypothetical protein